MSYKWRDFVFIFSIYVMNLGLYVDARLPCRHVHQEVTIPLRHSKTSKQYITTTETEWRKILLSLKWRSGILRLRLTPHNIAPEGTVAEWHEGNNLTEIEILRDESMYYRGKVVGKDHSYVALQVDGKRISGMIQNGREGIFIEPLEETSNSSTYGRHKLSSCGRIQPPPMDLSQLSHRKVAGMYSIRLESCAVGNFQTRVCKCS